VGVQAGDGVDGDGFAVSRRQGAGSGGSGRSLGGVRETEPGGGCGLEGPVLLSAVTPAALAGRYRDAPPGQVLDLGAQARTGCFRAP
jgi:hypothetical protein